MHEERRKSPAFQFYPKDFLTDSKVILMPSEVRGLYITLLCVDWLEDGLPSDPKLWLSLARFEIIDKCSGGLRSIAEIESITAQLKECFIAHPEKDGFVTNPRLHLERKKQDKFHDERRRAGRKGGKKKWVNHFEENGNPSSANSSANVLLIAKPSSSPSSSSASSKEEKTTTPAFGTSVLTRPKTKSKAARAIPLAYSDHGFQEFWDAYPKHEGKFDAGRAWDSLSPDDTLRAEMLKALEQHKTTDQWTKQNGDFIPRASTWLNGRRWEDEINGGSRGWQY